MDQDKDTGEQHEQREAADWTRPPSWSNNAVPPVANKLVRKMKAMKVFPSGTDIYLHNSIKVSFRKFHFHFYLLNFFYMPVYPLPPTFCLLSLLRLYIFFSASKINNRVANKFTKLSNTQVSRQCKKKIFFNKKILI